MQPFNLQAALAGEPVLTREGRKVTEIAAFKTATPWVFYAVVDGKVLEYDKCGISPFDERYDLFMSPEKREAWLIIYSDSTGEAYGSCYKTEADAKNFIKYYPGPDVIRCVRVEYEV